MRLYFGRGKRKLEADFKSDDFYKFYKDKFGDRAVPKDKWMRIWRAFIDARMKMLIYDNLEFYLPHRLGSLRIKVGTDVLKIDKDGNLKAFVDWGATLRKWEELYPGKTPEELKEIKDKPKVYYVNEHTNYKKLHWYWDKITCNFVNKSVYKLDMIRSLDRMITTKIKKTKKYDYYE